MGKNLVILDLYLQKLAHFLIFKVADCANLGQAVLAYTRSHFKHKV